MAAALLTISISSSAFAHTHLTGTNPTDGEEITTTLNEIVLEFDGNVEQGSFIDITTTSGQAVEIQDIIIGEGTLTGTVAEALPNDEYQVNWGIISEDGHPLEGVFSFTVNAPVPDVAEEAAEPIVEEPPMEAVEETTETTEQQSAQEQEAATVDDVDEEKSSSSTVLYIVLLVVIVAGVIFFFTKRKKK